MHSNYDQIVAAFFREKNTYGENKYDTVMVACFILSTACFWKRVPFGLQNSILFGDFCTERENSKMRRGTEFAKNIVHNRNPKGTRFQKTDILVNNWHSVLV